MTPNVRFNLVNNLSCHLSASVGEVEFPDYSGTLDLERGQNIVEMHISHGTFACHGQLSHDFGAVELNEGLIPAENQRLIQTFVTYDFFEHETQSTQVMTGLRPDYSSTSQVC